MARLLPWCVGLLFTLVAIPASAKVQCSCPNISADGEGNTSCSASESGRLCTIDFHLFGPESEKRAAELLARFGKVNLKPPEPGASAVEWLSSSPPEQVIDAVLVYMTVAAGDQNARAPDSVPLGSLFELVDAVRKDSLRTRILDAFSRGAQEKWSTQSDEGLRRSPIPFENIGAAIVSPGCVEFRTTAGLWMMFKASWSPARVTQGCRSKRNDAKY